MRKLLFLWFTFATAAAVSAAPPPATKLNVLFIATDDWRVELGCYGTPGMITPHVDQFASTAVRFERAYCQFPLCNPSRTSLLSGRYPAVTGVMDNETFFRDAHPDWVTLPQHFKQNGYFSGSTGKIFHLGLDDPRAWTEVVEAKVPPGHGLPKVERVGPVKMKTVQGQQKPKQNPTASDRIIQMEGDGEDHEDFYIALEGIKLLEKHKDEPFFIAVGFHKPHSPPTAPKKFFDLYDPAKIELPPDFAPKPAALPGFPVASINPHNGDLFIDRDASPEEARLMIQAYHASCSWTDWNVGRVLDALDRLDLAKNTIAVFFGDHGYHLGEKGKWSKHGSLYEVGARAPLIVRLPGAKGNGQPSPRTVQFLDIYPTLSELCGLPAQAELQGHSFASLLQAPSGAWPYTGSTVSGNGQAVRTEHWRYAEYTGNGEGAMLLDETADPHELKNVADDPQNASVVAEMKKLLAGTPQRPPMQGKKGKGTGTPSKHADPSDN